MARACELEWDRDFAPALRVWLSYGGWPPGGPASEQVALEPCTSMHDDLAGAMAAGQERILEPGARAALVGPLATLVMSAAVPEACVIARRAMPSGPTIASGHPAHIAAPDSARCCACTDAPDLEEGHDPWLT